MKLFKVLFGYSKGLVLLAAVMGAVGGAASVGLLAIINYALERQDSVPQEVLIWSFAGLCLLVPVIRFASAVLLLMLGERVVLDMRMQLSRRILAAPLRNLEEVGPHRLLVALTDDLNSLTRAVTVIPVLCINLALVIGCLAYLGWLSWVMLLGILVAMAVGIGGYQLSMGRSVRHLRRARDTRDALYQHFRALNDGIKELKLHGRRSEKFLTKLESTGDDLRRMTISAMAILHASASWAHLLLFTFLGLVVFLAPALGYGSGELLTGFVIALIYMVAPLEVIMDAFPILGRASVAVGKVGDLGLSLHAEAGEGETRGPEIVEPGWKRLELEGVSCAYHVANQEESFTLGPVDLTLQAGELVFFTGGNGSGKTTLAKILCGLYGPELGRILLDGELITDQNRDGYRQHFSAIFSDFFLFESLLGLEHAELDEKARLYLSQLHLDKKVEIQDGALSTTELSQGQRRRLALLTAYLEDRPVYLFDEWAADQDPEFKGIFYHQLLPELKARGKTVFVISHDDRYYDVADRLIKLDYGKIEYDSLLDESWPTRVEPAAHKAL